MVDRRAFQILNNTYWGSDGWKQEKQISPDDFEYAKSKGYMFEDVSLSHDEALVWLRKSFEKLEIEDISNAFLASFNTRRLDIRSALGSYAVAKNFPKHKFKGERYCEICGLYENNRNEELSILSFERFKWGGVRHDNPIYMAFDLEQFSLLEKIKPNKEDLEIMKRILDFIIRISSDAKPRDVEKGISKILKSNKAEREILIQILAYCGILQSKNRSSFFQQFVSFCERDIPAVNKIDWTYPLCWWRGEDGINNKALNYYFPQL